MAMKLVAIALLLLLAVGFLGCLGEKKPEEKAQEGAADLEAPEFVDSEQDAYTELEKELENIEEVDIEQLENMLGEA